MIPAEPSITLGHEYVRLAKAFDGDVGMGQVELGGTQVEFPQFESGAQLFDNSGNVLSGGKIYTYAAGTSTPATTYTDASGNTANSNPIILNSAGRVPYEIWLTLEQLYKFVLKDSNDTLIATYDNIEGVNSSFVAYTGQNEIQVATADQSVFTLTQIQYVPDADNLVVFVEL